ncbi:hypothetical protein ABK040_011603 [Willaertia magna]
MGQVNCTLPSVVVDEQLEKLNFLEKQNESIYNNNNFIQNVDIISLIMTFLSLREQILFCFSNKFLFNTFIIDNKFNRFFYLNLISSNNLGELFNDEEIISSLIEKNNKWRRLIDIFISNNNYFINPMKEIIFENNCLTKNESSNNYTFGLQRKDFPKGNLSALLSITQQQTLCQYKLIEKAIHSNVAIGFGDEKFYLGKEPNRFLGFPKYTLSLSSDGQIRSNFLSTNCISTNIKLSIGDIITIIYNVKLIKEKPLFIYEFLFLVNGKAILPQKLMIETNNYLFPCLTLHTIGDSFEIYTFSSSTTLRKDKSKNDSNNLNRINNEKEILRDILTILSQEIKF